MAEYQRMQNRPPDCAVPPELAGGPLNVLSKPDSSGSSVIAPTPGRVATRPGWVSLAEIANALQMPLRSVRRQSTRLPDHARDKRRGLLNMTYLPPEWRAALAGYGATGKASSGSTDPVEWRPGDVRRDGEIRHICDQFNAYLADRLDFQPDLTQGQALQDFCKRYGRQFLRRRLKPNTLRRWLKRHRDGGDFKETRGRKRGSFDGAIGPAARARFFGEYLRNGVPLTVAYGITKAEALRNAGAPAWSCPSEATFRRWIKTEFPEFYTKPCREGWRKWRADCEPKLIRDQHALFVGNELWEIDASPGDYFVRFNGRKVRPTVVMVIDVASGLVVGSAVGPSESQETIIRALRRAIEAWGVAYSIRTDLGKAFLGESVGDQKGRRAGIDVVGVFDQLGVGLETCTGRSPWQKGAVEAAFNGFRQRYAPLHGKAFINNNHKNRVPGVDKWCDDHLDKLKTLEEDDRLVGAFFEAENRRPRKHLSGLSPLQHFERTAIPKREVPTELLDFVFSRVQRVRVTDRGIAVSFGHTRLHYGQRDPRVWEQVGRDVTIRVDDDKPESIWLCDQSGRALFRVENDAVIGTDGRALREAGKRKQKARKLVRDHYKNVEVAAAHPIDAALELQREYAEAMAAKNEPKVKRERGKRPLLTRATASLKTVRQENLRHAAGAEGMTAGGGGLSFDDLQGTFSAPDTDAGPELSELGFDGHGGPQDDAFARLVETSNDERRNRTAG